MSTPPPPSAEIIGHNEDLLTELLTHLPFNHLLHLKLVSKQWNSLISHHHPHFSLLHSLRHPHLPSSAIFFLHHHHLSLSSTYDFIPFSPSSTPLLPPFLNLLKSSRFDILQSCNGLLLCSSSGTIYVCNPSTNDDVTPVGDDDGGSVNLGFDPAVSPHYKVVRVLELAPEENIDHTTTNTNSNSYSIDVYCSGTKRWRKNVASPFTCPFDVEFDHGVYWEGRVHWLSHTETTVYLDLDTGRVETLMLPNAIEGSYIERFRYFGESCGHLHLIEIRTNCVREFNVLELCKDDKVEWLVKYRVDLDVLGRGFESELFQDHRDRFGRGFRFYAFSVLAVVRAGIRGGDGDGDGDDDSVLILSIPGKVISYSFRTRVSTLLSNVVDESDKLFPFRGHNAFQFIQSLYCVS